LPLTRYSNDKIYNAVIGVFSQQECTETYVGWYH